MKSSSCLPKEPPAEVKTAPVRVLLIDDDEDEFIITRRIISEIVGQPYLLDWASTYENGLDTIAENRHDIYLIDYHLNGRTGLELLKEATATGCTQPIILLTGQENREIDVEAMKAGVWDYLVKGSLSAPVLERAIRYTLEHKKVLDLHLSHQRQREKFVATLTHDLKTPIKAEYRIFESLLGEKFGPITEEQASVLREMQHSNRFMSQMVDNLLTAFKMEEGHLILRVEPCDMNELIRSTLMQDLHALAQDKQQNLIFDLQPQLPVIPLDGLEVRRVIYNLVQNAINYSPVKSNIIVMSRFHDYEMHITVEDNGPGIDEAMQKTLFEPYASLAKRYRHIGTGLGLYISSKIVEAHSGRFEVETAKGKGSRFTFILPEEQPESVHKISF